MDCLGYINNGNLAEWAQVILSTIGMAFIIWTLIAQLKVTRLEHRKFIQANIPLFKMQIIKNSEGNQVLKMLVDDNHVKEYKIDIITNLCKVAAPGLEIYNSAGLIKGQFVDWDLIIPNDSFNRPSSEQLMEFNVYYMDVYGYAYCQIIHVFLNGGNVGFPPRPIGRNINLVRYSSKLLEQKA